MTLQPHGPRNKRKRKRGTYAAIDLGTSNCRLLIVKPTPHSFAVVESFSKISRLGEGLNETGELSEKAVSRTISALKLCAAKLKKRPISQGRYVATEACRKALNADEFIRRVRKETGLPLEIISAEEEARLAVAGCVPLLSRSISHTLVFDIGGGSTEISWASVSKVGTVSLNASASLPLGVITVSEAFTGKGLSHTDFAAVSARTKELLKNFGKEHAVAEKIAAGEIQVIGTSGTVTTLAAFHLELPKYNREAVDGMRMATEDIYKAIKKIAKMTHRERVNHPCIGVERADLVMAGCAILDGIFSFFSPVEEITIADRGLREGILMDLMQKTNDRVTLAKR